MAKILVVDDDQDLVSAVRVVLENEGHNVITASNTSDARKALEEQHPALLVLDVMMESTDDGVVLAQDLRRQGNRIPILMLTSLPKAVGMSFTKDDLMVPVDEFVEKPVAPRRLVELVNRLLSARR